MHVNISRAGILKYYHFDRLSSTMQDINFLPTCIVLADIFGDMLDSDVTSVVGCLLASIRSRDLNVEVGFHAHDSLGNGNCNPNA